MACVREHVPSGWRKVQAVNNRFVTLLYKLLNIANYNVVARKLRSIKSFHAILQKAPNYQPDLNSRLKAPKNKGGGENTAFLEVKQCKNTQTRQNLSVLKHCETFYVINMQRTASVGCVLRKTNL